MFLDISEFHDRKPDAGGERQSDVRHHSQNVNLQSGSVVINMDMPWNPAVLGQRIGRVHRMGHKRSVRGVNFISKDSIEEQGVRVDAVTPSGQGNVALNELLQCGAQFLMNLSRAVSSPVTAGDTSGVGGGAIGNAVGFLVERDEATGKSCLKIPLPAPEVLSQLVSGLGQLLAGIFSQIPKGVMGT